MENEKNHSRLWIILIVVAGFLLSCSLSALGGGAVGYLVGRQAARRELNRPAYRSEAPRVLPLPEVPNPGDRGSELPMGVGGALVTVVTPGSPAERSGIKEGDLIVAVDDQPLEMGEDLAKRILSYNVGDGVTLRIVRGRHEAIIPVTLGRNPERSDVPWLGIEYRTLGMPSDAQPFELPRQNN